MIFADRDRVLARFHSKTNKTESCWLWTGALWGHGYGNFVIGRKGRYMAHRVAYELFVGPIPSGLTIDHLCRTKACVNPAHLEAVTFKENVLRGISPQAVNARKTHCVNGHEFTEENTQRRRGGNTRPTSRTCLACRRAREKGYYHQKRKGA